MSAMNEDAAKKALNIQSWQQLSKDKVLSFIEVMPELDRDVALSIVGQLPNFKDLALGAYKALEEMQKSAINSDHESQQRVHEAFKDYRSALKRELRRGDLSSEQRMEILEKIREAAERDFAKDSERKAFVLKVVGASLSVVILIGAGAVAIATGGRVNFKSS